MKIVRASVLLVVLCCPGISQRSVDRESLGAIEVAREAVLAHPDSESDFLVLASLYLRAGQNARALQILQASLKVHRESPQTLRLMAVAYLRLNDYGSAKNAAEQALRSARDSATVEVLGMARLGLQDTDAAEALFQEALKLDAKSAEANLQLGLLYAKQRRNLSEAIRLLEKAHALQPQLAGTCAALGSAYLDAGHARLAVAALNKAIQLDSMSAQPYYLLASAYKQLYEDKKAAQALAEFQSRNKMEADERAREMRSRADYEAGVNLLSNTEQLDQAYELLAKAAGERPRFDAAYYRMAQVSYLQGDSRRALGLIRTALQLNSWEPEYYYVLARCLQTTDARGAVEAVEKAISLKPGVADFDELRRELKAQH